MKKLLVSLSISLALMVPSKAEAHLLKPFEPDSHKSVVHELNHALYVCKRGSGHPKKEHCKAVPWLRKLEVESRPAPPMNYWAAKQIAAAESIGHKAGSDPWPNCADPIFNGAASWEVTVACENNTYYELYGFPTAWMDSPGYYRCGLQFDPMWENVFGKLCP